MGVKQSDVVLNFKTNGQVQFSQTVKDINGVMNTASKEYRNQISALGDNATATQKLQLSKAKLEIQLEGATKRSRLLREDYEKSVKETGKYSEESKKLYNQLMNSENGENKLRTALEKTNKELKNQSIFSDELKNNLEKMNSVGEKVSGVGKKLSLLVTAPAAAMTAGLIKNGIEVRKFRAQAQIYYEGLYQDTKKAKDQLDDLMTFAKTTPYSYESIVEADQIMQTFGMSTGRAKEVLDALANTIASTGGSSQDLSSLATVMGQIESSGKLSLQDMNQLINAKIPAFKIVGNELGMSVMDLRESITKGEVTSERAITALTKGLMQGTDGMNGATQAYSGALGEVKQQLPGAIDSLKSAFKNLALGLVSEDIFAKMIESVNKLTEMINSGAFLPVIQNVSEALGSVLDVVIQFAEWFGKLSPEMQQMAVKVLALTVLLGPLLIFVGKMISAISTLAIVFGKVAIALGISQLALLGIIVAVLAVIAIGVLLYKNWDLIKEKAAELGEWIASKWKKLVEDTQKAWDDIKQKISDTWNGIKEAIEQKIDDIKKTISDKWNEIKTGISDIISGIVTSVREKWDEIKANAESVWESIVETLTPILDFLGRMIMAPISLVQTLLEIVWGLIKAGAEIAWAAISMAASTAWEAIREHIITPIVRVYDQIVQLFTDLGAWFSLKWAEFKEIASLAWEAFRQAVIDPVVKLYQDVKARIDELVTNIVGKFNEVKESATKIWTDIKTAVSTKFNETKDDVVKTATSIWTDLTDKFSKILKDVKVKFREIGKAISDPIIEAKDKIGNAIEKMVEWFANLKFPKFSVKMSSKKILGKEIEYPSGIDVVWNAKGAIFNRPVVAGTYGGVPQGFGEAGPEAAIPLNEENLGAIGRGIAATMSGGVEQHIHIGKVNTGSMSEVNEMNRGIQRSATLADFALGGG